MLILKSQKRPFPKLNLDEKFVGLLKQTEEKKKKTDWG